MCHTCTHVDSWCACTNTCTRTFAAPLSTAEPQCEAAVHVWRKEIVDPEAAYVQPVSFRHVHTQTHTNSYTHQGTQALGHTHATYRAAKLQALTFFGSLEPHCVLYTQL